MREWKKQREELQALPPKKKRLEGGGRKAALPSVEEEVVVWIDEMQAENQQVTRARIQQKALSIARSRRETDFTASRGWLERVCRQHHLSLRRRTTVSQRLPTDLVPTVVSVIMKTRKLRLHHGYPLSSIGNMDETPLWLDMPGDKTITRQGDRTVCICTTGHVKMRFTVVLSAMADGESLNLMCTCK